MKLKIVGGGIVAVLLLAGASGCASLTKTAEAEAAAEAAAPRVGEPLLKAFVDDDAKAFLALLPDVVTRDFGEAGFKKTRSSMQEQIGTPVSYEFVLNLEHPTFTISVWKIRCERKSSDQQKTLTQDCLFRAVSGKVDGQERLLAFNFF